MSLGSRLRQLEMEREIEIDTEREREIYRERDAFVSSQIKGKVLYK